MGEYEDVNSLVKDHDIHPHEKSGAEHALGQIRTSSSEYSGPSTPMLTFYELKDGGSHPHGRRGWPNEEQCSSGSSKWWDQTHDQSVTSCTRDAVNISGNHEFAPRFWEVGDVNQDGQISVRDSVLILQHLVGMEPDNFHKNLADVNINGEVSIRDSVLILQYLVGMDVEADLTVSNFTAPDDAEPGETVRIIPTIKNEGDFGAVELIRYEFAKGGSDSSYQTERRWVNIGGVNMPERSTHKMLIDQTIPTTADPGEYYEYRIFIQVPDSIDILLGKGTIDVE